jgi:NitT/TauT family transport system substrate-binding protein
MANKTMPIESGFDPAIENRDGWTRREFLGTAALVGTGVLLGLPAEPVAAEPPPETTKIRLIVGTACNAGPSYAAQQFLLGEGFSDVQYIRGKGGRDDEKLLASGVADLDPSIALRHIIRVDAGDPIIMLGGLHVGCYELFGNNRVRAIRDLKGKSVAVTDLGSSRHVFLATMLKYVGFDPHKDVNWVTEPVPEAIRLFAEDKIDAIMAAPPEPQELRAKKIGHVVVNTMMDRPWSNYYCCMTAANREFARKHPVATKRALRAILKATDVCAREPERATRLLVDKGHTNNYDLALQTMKEMQMAYGMWREYDPEDTVRFYALRLQEIGMIKSSPQKIIAQGTDWRFLRELKKELKT